MKKIEKLFKILSQAGIQSTMIPSENLRAIDDAIVINDRLSISVGRDINVSVKIDEESFRLLPATLENVVSIVKKQLEK
jgi:hypothetical protein